jgi:hypothetical protein
MLVPRQSLTIQVTTVAGVAFVFRAEITVTQDLPILEEGTDHVGSADTRNPLQVNESLKEKQFKCLSMQGLNRWNHIKDISSLGKAVV